MVYPKKQGQCLVFLCIVVAVLGRFRRFMCFIYPYISGSLHWHWGNHMIAPVPMKWPWKIWVKLRYQITIKYYKSWTVCIFLGMYYVSQLIHGNSTTFYLLDTARLTHLPLVAHICVSELGQHWLAQVMACRLFSAKPLPQPMLTYCQLDP